MQEYDVQKAIEAQADFCKRKDAPHFAPKSGRCWNCGLNIYEQHKTNRYGAERLTGITVEQATTELVTGCPHCYRSYCD